MYYTVIKHDGHIREQGKEAKNIKTRFFYVLYSDKAWVFDQAERSIRSNIGIEYKTKTVHERQRFIYITPHNTKA